MKTLNDYAKEVHEANKKWWIDLEKPCIHCLGTGDCNHCCRIVPDEPYCEDCNGLGYEPLQRNVGEMLMLCVSELSEALEGHRKNLQDDKLPQYKMFDVEIADCFIRLFDICSGLNIDIETIYQAKMAYNKNRADHQIENRMKEGGKKY